MALEPQHSINMDYLFESSGNEKYLNHIGLPGESGVKSGLSWLKTIQSKSSPFSGHYCSTKLVGGQHIKGILIRYISTEAGKGPDGEASDLKNKALRINSGIDTRKFTIMVGQSYLIHLDEILYLHGSESLSCIHTFDRNYRIRMSLNDLAATISHPYFIKMKDSCIINAEHLYAFNDEEIYLKYKGKLSGIRFAESKLKDQTILCEFEDPGCIMPVFLRKISPEWHAWFLEVEKVMTKQLKSRIFSITNVASELGISSRQFQRNFIHHSGMKPRDFAMELRLVLAHRNLAQYGPKKLEQIAMQSGFKEVQHFKKVFRKRFGTDPGSVN